MYVFMFEGIPIDNEHMYGRILQGSLWVCVVVICAVYTGNLTAALASQITPWPFKDLDGLANHPKYKIITGDGSLREELFLVRLLNAALSLYLNLMSNLEGHKQMTTLLK